MDHWYQHNVKERAKARKSGPSLLRETKELGELAHVFVATAYWDPTHLCHRVEAYLPDGETVPDGNGLLGAIV